MKNYIYVFVREDLSNSQRIVQAGHAMIESTKAWPYEGDIPSVIVLGVKDEAELARAYATVIQCFDCKGFLEPYWNNSLTAFATRCVKETDRLFFKQWSLLR